MDSLQGQLLQSVAVLWGGSELVLARIRRAAPDSQRKDAGSFWVVNVAIYGAVAGGVWAGMGPLGHLSGWETPLWTIGFSLILLGLAFRWWAIYTLKQFFSVTVSVRSDHRIITAGPYSRIRHPSYTGALVSFIGMGLAFSNWLSVLLLVVPIAGALYYRITVEETALLEAFGADYQAYCRRTFRLIPGIY